MSDLIDRQAAIDALTEYGNGRTVYIGAEEAIRRIEQLPPAQPVDKDINVSCKDAISRQGAIDHFKSITDATSIGNKYNEGFVDGLNFAIGHLKTMPSVQPTYTDAEVQKMQDLHQAEVEKAFELGREDARAEIIHCGECKHKGTKNCVANVWAAIFGVTVKDNFYCGLAERRTDD